MDLYGEINKVESSFSTLSVHVVSAGQPTDSNCAALPVPIFVSQVVSKDKMLEITKILYKPPVISCYIYI